MSPNDPPKLADLARKAAVPEKLEKLDISAGLNIKNEEEGKEEKELRFRILCDDFRPEGEKIIELLKQEERDAIKKSESDEE